MFCQKCGAEIANDAKICFKCKALQPNAKFCQHCGSAIDKQCVICPKCGKQVMAIQPPQQPQVVINNANTNTNIARSSAHSGMRGAKNKWVAFFLCLFLGVFGVHKFYEGKILLGVVYIFTGGLFVIGWVIDLISLLFKPNPYYV